MRSLKGHLLIARPELDDSNFARTVILMLEHSADGAAGVVLNRPTSATVADIAEQVLGEPLDWDKPLRIGGPVPGPLMALHTLAEFSDSDVLPGLFSTVEAEKIQAIIRARVEPSSIVANYAGWGPGQLEGEFQVDSWTTLPATVEHVFWDDPEDLWDHVIKQAGSTALAEFLGVRHRPEDPSVN